MHRVASELRKHQGGSRSGLSGINRPVKNLNRNPRQANQLLSQQNRPIGDVAGDHKEEPTKTALPLLRPLYPREGIGRPGLIRR